MDSTRHCLYTSLPSPISRKSQTCTMSSSSPPGPITTIFTHLSGCFDAAPEIWQPCGVMTDGARCLWTLPHSCYPPGASIYSATNWGLGSTLFPNIYHYPPGVFPFGSSTQGGMIYATSTVAASGCLQCVWLQCQNLWLLLIAVSIRLQIHSATQLFPVIG